MSEPILLECLSVEQMQFFASLLGDIVSVVGPNEKLVVIDAEKGRVLWERLGDTYCMVKPEDA
ncbi:hypothetical protein [Cognatishimia sp.]|uniref:hypothetical protein n=1 Tax=Cognatishimia sp. TaxID=2211648 RepID=UPI003BABFEE3